MNISAICNSDDSAHLGRKAKCIGPTAQMAKFQT
jgi:hypothetical protein